MFRGKKLFKLMRLIKGLTLEESEQWLENVDRTNLVLGSGKLVQQKIGLNLMNVRWLDFIVPSSCFFSVLFYFYKDKLLLSQSDLE